MVGKVKKSKTFLAVLAALLFSAVFAGCGEYKPPQTGDNNPPVGPVDPNPPVDPTPSEDAFKVSLTLRDGSAFTKANYSKITTLQAQWTNADNTNEIYRAYFNEEGVASRSDLDGDYTVTLVTPPDGYTYKSTDKSHEATNLSKETDIELWPLLSLGKREIYANSTPYYSLASTGAYRISLGVGEKIMFNFKPQGQGEYCLETFADVVANEINPKLDVHNGNLPAYMNPAIASSQDGGGAENTYTKNIKWLYNVSSDQVGSGLIFKLYSESRNPNAKELLVDFILEWMDDYDDPTWLPSVEVPITETLEKQQTPAGTFTFCANRPAANKTLNAKNVKLNPDDGYYYYYDAQTGYGDRLYAMLGGDNEVHSSFNNANIKLNYIMPDRKERAKNYENFVRGANGYMANANSDGCYPVTEELKRFLQDYAKSQSLFFDGNGLAETKYYEDENGRPVSGPAYVSDENSQWMYACGYYAL